MHHGGKRWGRQEASLRTLPPRPANARGCPAPKLQEGKEVKDLTVKSLLLTNVPSHENGLICLFVF
jgi:hypothetical protein